MGCDKKIRVVLLHGAKGNAGDFLIRERTAAFLRYCYPQCDIYELFRNEPLAPYLDQINARDVLVFAGGPGYQNTFYAEGCAPLVENLDDIKVPLVMLGMGWWGYSGSPLSVYNFSFSEKMRALLTRASRDTNILGCRDYYSVNVLRNNGFGSALMTGCPAWYDLENIDQLKYRGKPLHEVRKICVSDCGNVENIRQAFQVIDFLKEFFQGRELVYVCHRGIPVTNPSMESLMAQAGVKLVDISRSGEGFGIYDDCDLHIGFRVHAHIYNLSRRKLSVLIEEDSRGGGVNDALGLPHISTMITGREADNVIRVKNDYVCLQLEDYLLNLAANRYAPIEGAYYLMRQYFDRMIDHIGTIHKYI